MVHFKERAFCTTSVARSKWIVSTFSLSDPRLSSRFPSSELSVLDNKLNAVAKAKWRQHRHNEDFSWDAFLLFAELHLVEQDSFFSWWT